MREGPTPELNLLFEEARQYEERKDHYNAVKLYKRIVRDAHSWAAPFACLGRIYKYRQEWKPALYYSKKAVSLDATDQASWWNVGIAATALKKNRLARSVWAKFGFDDGRQWPHVSIQRAYDKQFELMWVERNGPAQGIIRNIPHPDSRRRYGDTVLFDNTIRGFHTSDYYRLPIYDDLGVLRHSIFRTFSCLLQSAGQKDIRALQRLCVQEGLGFEVWANATRAFSSPQLGPFPEYYAFNPGPGQELLTAIAAPDEKQALAVLESWKVISLKEYTGFQYHPVS
ncbi:MAG: hypothetical protein KDC66_22300 [Phaeodactylibacter sp.]|nr:hypothetical protein [Phaeodactylibacter sp.]MCB9272495.1 hypothetical protein [Lewinellaceae bacterium]